MKKKRFFTKAVSMLLTFVMLVSLVPQTGMTAKAAGPSVTLYFELPDGASASDWGINVWGGTDGVTVTEKGSTTVRPTAWGDGAGYPTLLTKADLPGWGYATVEGTISGVQFVSLDNNPSNCWNSQIAAEGLTEAYYDPDAGKWYKESSKTTEIVVAEARDIYVLAGVAGLAGSNWDQNDTNNQLTKNGTKHSITYHGVAPGTYEYKILQDPERKGWDLPFGGGDNRSVTVEAPADVTFTIDTEDNDKNVTVDQTLIKELIIDNGNIKKGAAVPLTTTASYYDGVSKTPQDVTVTYTLKNETPGITLEGNKITVAESVTAETVVVVAAYDTFTKEITLPIVTKEYTVNINMYSQDLDMTPGVSDIYIFEQGGTHNTIVDLTGTLVDDENGVTWVTGTTKLAFNSLGVIARDVAGSWNGGQDADMFYTIDEDATEITLWYVYGDGITTEKPTITKTEQRYFYLEYQNKTLEDTLPQFYSWTTGYAAKRIDFEDQGEGNYLVKVPVKKTCTKVDFVIVLDASGDPWIKDGGDHSISFPLGQTVVCASMAEGEEPELSAPYNVGYELQPKQDQISFYYRDDKALVDGTLEELEPKVEIDGTEYPMTWNGADKRFVYVKEGLENGRMDYRYHVGGEYALDKYNANTETKDEVEYSYVDYYQLNAQIHAEVMNASFNYNENNLVKFEVDQAEEDPKDFEVTKASIDVSSLGGSSDLTIEPELQAVTISVTTDTELGQKELPMVVTDQYNNEYTTSVDVTVVKREKAANDFDWDEACVYFMVTDRFFDGNQVNNTASDEFLPEDSTVESTYGKDNEGLYHGGDFAGVTAKLDYLKDLGINTIWITPIVENIPGVAVTGEGSDDVPYNAAYHGYWASDFTKLNPTLGTEAEFENMIDEAHSRGIKIMVDIVVNHAGYDTLDTFGDMIRSGSDVVPGDDQKDSLSNLPDFKTEDATVRAKLVEWQTTWMQDYGIDYYRVDTVKHVEGTTWAALKNSTTKVNPSFKMIGEYSGAGYASNGGSLGTGQMDSDLDFDFNDQATNFVRGNISGVESFLAGRNAALNNAYLTGQFLGSHDEVGFKQNLLDSGMETDDAEAAALVAATLQITAKGQPVIYYGEELGQTGENIYPYQSNRYDLDWSKATDDNKTYQHYKKLLAARQAYVDIFARGDRQVVAGSNEDGYDIVKRSYGTDSLFVGMNIKDEDQTVVITGCDANASYKDVYAGRDYQADGDGKITITLPKSSEGGTVILAKNSTAVPPGTTQDPGATQNPPGATQNPPTATQNPPVDTVKVTKLSITAPSKKLAAGKKVALGIKVTPSSATDKSVSWSTSNKKYATINKNGKLTLKKAGAGKSVTVTAAANDGSNVKATLKVKIMKNAVTKIALKAAKTVKAGKKLTVKSTVKANGKNANKTLQWTSSNTKYATVSSKGVVKAAKAGKGKKVTITAAATDGSGKKAKTTITIK